MSWLFIMPMVSSMTASAPPGTNVDFNQWRPLSIVIAVLAGVLSVMLAVGGAGLLKRRPWSPTCLRAFSILKILFGILSAVFAFSMMQSQIANFQSQGSPKTPIPASLMSFFAVFGAAVAILWSAALPVFLLVWFSLSNIRRETAEWSIR